MRQDIIAFVASVMLAASLPAVEYATTNLNDSLNTQITYEKGSDFNIKTLEIRSIEVDKKTADITALTWKGPKKLKVPQVRKISLSGSEIRVLNSLSNDIWLARLRPMVSKRDKDAYRGFLYKGIQSVSLDQIDLSTGKIVLDAEKLADFDIDKIKSNMGKICRGFDTLAVNDLGIKSTSLTSMGRFTCRPGAITVYDSLDTGKYSITNAYSVKLLAIDNSRFNVYWSAETYEELEQMRKAYKYGQSYGGATSPRMKDLEKLLSTSDWTIYYQWMNKLWDNKELDIQFIKPTSSFKIIGEAWIYSNRWDKAVKEQFAKNLVWTKAKGYDTVLTRFDCSENITNWLEMVQTIRDNGMKVFTVYVGQDNTCPRWNPYINIDKFESFFKQATAAADGYFLGWRETSTHVRLLPSEFFNYICKLAREANPQILIYGEIYYGQTSDSAGRRALYYNLPKNVSGVVVQNMGFQGYNHGYIVQRLFRKIVPNYKSYDKIFQVIGIGPYYKTKTGHHGAWREGLTLTEEYAAKAEVENSFKKYGVKTVTMIHDGVDDNYTFYIADPKDDKHWNATTDNMLYDTTLTD